MTPDDLFEEELANEREEQERIELRAENARLREQLSSDHWNRRLGELLDNGSRLEEEGRQARAEARMWKEQVMLAIREQERLRYVIRAGGAMLRAERQVLGGEQGADAVLTQEEKRQRVERAVRENEERHGISAPARAQLCPRVINREGLTLDEWAAAAGIEQSVVTEEQQVAWYRGEDPTEHRGVKR